MKNVFKNLLGAVAPSIGTALGGPMGGIAGKILSETLGVPNNQRSLEQALQNASPEQLAEIKKAELSFEAEMKKLDVDIFALEAQEKESARKYFSKDWTARIIGIATIGGFLGYIFLVTLQPPEQNSEALINLVLGYLGGLASAIISFYFGASQSNDKD
tara:strand:+ start:865 stop:1341 length:477 start_codon:yes stop_codon:yes gene_type:complete